MQLLSDLSEDNLRSRLKEQKNSHIWYMAWPFRNIRSWLHTSVCDDPAVFKSNVVIDQQHNSKCSLKSLKFIFWHCLLHQSTKLLYSVTAYSGSNKWTLTLPLAATSPSLIISWYSSVLTSWQPNLNVGLRLVGTIPVDHVESTNSVQMIMSTALSATGDLYRNYSLQQ